MKHRPEYIKLVEHISRLGEMTTSDAEKHINECEICQNELNEGVGYEPQQSTSQH